MTRLYTYVAPAGIKARVAGRPAETPIRITADLLAWLRQADADHGLLAATFVIDAAGDLLLADRRSEHVACAGGGPVLAAGKMFFTADGDEVELTEVSNQSTGYSPEPESWPAVDAALDRVGVRHPGRFTREIVSRRCEACGERSVVKDEWFVCGVCGVELPERWNF